MCSVYVAELFLLKPALGKGSIIFSIDLCHYGFISLSREGIKMVDFKKRLNQGSVERKVNPIDIYDTIDRKSITGPLRPAQKNILTSWYETCKKSAT